MNDVGGAVHLLDDDRVQRHGVIVAAERILFLGAPLVHVPLDGLVALLAVAQTDAERTLRHNTRATASNITLTTNYAFNHLKKL